MEKLKKKSKTKRLKLDIRVNLILDLFKFSRGHLAEDSPSNPEATASHKNAVYHAENSSIIISIWPFYMKTRFFFQLNYHELSFEK